MQVKEMGCAMNSMQSEKSGGWGETRGPSGPEQV